MNRKARWHNYCERLASDLDAIETLMMELLDASKIVHADRNRFADSGVVVVAPTRSWGKADHEQTRLQMRGLEAYETWFSRFRLLFRSPTPKLKNSMKKLDEFVRAWFGRGGWDWGVPNDIPAAKEKARASDLRNSARCFVSSAARSSRIPPLSLFRTPTR